MPSTKFWTHNLWAQLISCERISPLVSTAHFLWAQLISCEHSSLPVSTTHIQWAELISCDWCPLPVSAFHFLWVQLTSCERSSLLVLGLCDGAFGFSLSETEHCFIGNHSFLALGSCLHFMNIWTVKWTLVLTINTAIAVQCWHWMAIVSSYNCYILKQTITFIETRLIS